MRYILAATFYVLTALSASAYGTLILLVDISNSIIPSDIALQQDAYAYGMHNISWLDGVHIEVILFHREIMHISSGSRIDAANAFINTEVPVGRGSTCMTAALNYIAALVPELPEPVLLDISGDGESNCSSRDTTLKSKDSLVELGVQINTLYVEPLSMQNHEYDDGEFFKSLTSPYGFNIHIKTFEDIQEAIYRKLAIEVAQLRSSSKF